jgi:hypothetical protein
MRFLCHLGHDACEVLLELSVPLLPQRLGYVGRPGPVLVAEEFFRGLTVGLSWTVAKDLVAQPMEPGTEMLGIAPSRRSSCPAGEPPDFSDYLRIKNHAGL